MAPFPHHRPVSWIPKWSQYKDYHRPGTASLDDEDTAPITYTIKEQLAKVLRAGAGAAPGPPPATRSRIQSLSVSAGRPTGSHVKAKTVFRPTTPAAAGVGDKEVSLRAAEVSAAALDNEASYHQSQLQLKPWLHNAADRSPKVRPELLGRGAYMIHTCGCAACILTCVACILTSEAIKQCRNEVTMVHSSYQLSYILTLLQCCWYVCVVIKILLAAILEHLQHVKLCNGNIPLDFACFTLCTSATIYVVDPLTTNPLLPDVCRVEAGHSTSSPSPPLPQPPPHPASPKCQSKSAPLAQTSTPRSNCTTSPTFTTPLAQLPRPSRARRL